MRKLFILIAVVISMYSQQFPEPKIIVKEHGLNETNLKLKKDDFFSKLNKNKLKYGILKDKSIDLSGIEQYTGKKKNKLLNASKWRYLLSDINKSFIEKRNSIDFDSFQKQVNKKLKENIIPIGIINYKYHKIHPNAIEKGWLKIEDEALLENVSTDSIYQEARVFAVSALKNKTFQGQDFYFQIDKQFFHTNTKFSKLEIDANDGLGYQKLTIGKKLNVRYTDKGRKAVNVRLVTENNEILISSFEFQVSALSVPQPDINWYLNADIPYNGSVAMGKASIYLAGNKIRKPILVVEGFDVEENINRDSMYVMLSQHNLMQDFNYQGFDFIFLDFDYSKDYIQKNAYLVVKLIQRINAEREGSELTTIIGASMGGLVSRYALAYMEKQNIVHHVRTFVSYDSPQQGANIPLGDQYWLNFFSSESDEAKNKINALRTPAAKQMLLYHIDGANTRNAFVNDLTTLGNYPSQLRKVAIANGSGYGNGILNFPAGDQMVYSRYRDWKYDLDGNTWAVPNISPETKIFRGMIDVLGPSYRSQDVSITNTRPLDNAPGGMSDTNQKIVDGLPSEITRKSANQPNHCFIPTISALDIATTDVNYRISSDSQILSKTPFNKIYYPYSNENHVAVTNNTKRWLIQELIKINTPDQLSVSRSGTQMFLSWRDNADNEDSYIVYYRKGSEAWKSVRLAKNVTNYTLQNMNEVGIYSFYVKGEINISGTVVSSPNSTIASSTIPSFATLTGPTFLTTGAWGTWSINPTNAQNYDWYGIITSRVRTGTRKWVDENGKIHYDPIYENQTRSIEQLNSSANFAWRPNSGDFKISLTVNITKNGLKETKMSTCWIENDGGPMLPRIAGTFMEEIPKDFRLSQNYPNPFNPTTTISYALPKTNNVKIYIYNSLGQIVKTFTEGLKDAGIYKVVWDASRMASGMYFYRIEAGEFSATQKMILLK